MYIGTHGFGTLPDFWVLSYLSVHLFGGTLLRISVLSLTTKRKSSLKGQKEGCLIRGDSLDISRFANRYYGCISSSWVLSILTHRTVALAVLEVVVGV